MTLRIAALASVSLAIMVIVAVACSDEGLTDEDALATARAAVATEQAEPGSLNRTDCETIRGTDYLSPGEREWFLANCTDQVPSPTQDEDPIIPARETNIPVDIDTPPFGTGRTTGETVNDSCFQFGCSTSSFLNRTVNYSWPENVAHAEMVSFYMDQLSRLGWGEVLITDYRGIYTIRVTQPLGSQFDNAISDRILWREMDVQIGIFDGPESSPVVGQWIQDGTMRLVYRAEPVQVAYIEILADSRNQAEAAQELHEIATNSSLSESQQRRRVEDLERGRGVDLLADLIGLLPVYDYDSGEVRSF